MYFNNNYDVSCIFQFYHITVDGIKLPGEVLNATEDNDSVMSQYLWLVVTGVVVAFCLTILLTVAVVIAVRRRRIANK